MGSLSTSLSLAAMLQYSTTWKSGDGSNGDDKSPPCVGKEIEMSKVILSRKGFDSSSGGDYSRFDPETGRYVLLPIPEETAGSAPRYEEIGINSGYLTGVHADNLRDFIYTDSLRFSQKAKRKAVKRAHLDPWLGPCPWLATSSNHSIGAFGQTGAAQTHLSNCGVGKGSLFVFFSRFKPVGSNRRFSAIPTIRSEHLSRGAYFIYGWLRVGRILEGQAITTELAKHPHAAEKYRKSNDSNNTVYLAGDKLFIGGSGRVPGCGYFPNLSKDLLLTADDDSQGSQKWLPSRWKLPGFLATRRPSVLKTRSWSPLADGSYLVETAGRWQEAVFDETEEFRDYFERLLHIHGMQV